MFKWRPLQRFTIQGGGGEMRNESSRIYATQMADQRTSHQPTKQPNNHAIDLGGVWDFRIDLKF